MKYCFCHAEACFLGRSISKRINDRRDSSLRPKTAFVQNDARKGISQKFPIKNGAFTLIELIMTIVVVSIAAIPLSLLVSQHVTSVFQSADYTMAVNLGRFEMEKVNNMIYANIATASFSNYQGYSYDITRTVSYAPGGGSGATAESLKKIQVDVKKAGSATVIVSFITYIAKNVLYGL